MDIRGRHVSYILVYNDTIMKVKFSVVIVFFLLSVSSVSAQYFLKDNPYMFSAERLSEEQIRNNLKKHKKVFSLEEVDAARTSVSLHNELVNKKINHVQNKREQLVSLVQELMKQPTIASIDRQIYDENVKYSTIKKSTLESLETLKFTGIFIYVRKGIEPFGESKSANSKVALSKITPMAIEKIRGSFISSVTDTYTKNGSTEMISYIKEEVSGQVKASSNEAKIIGPEGLFTYVGVMEVLPLQESISKGKNSSSGSGYDYIVVDALDARAKSKLREFGVSESRISKLYYYVNSVKNSSSKSNSNAKRQETNYINKGNVRLNEINNAISLLNQKKDSTHNYYASFINKNTGLKYDPETSSVDVQESKQFLLDKIKSTSDLEIVLNERILKSKWLNVVTHADNISLGISQMTNTIINQLNKGLGQVEQFDQSKILENNNYSSSVSQDNKFDSKLDKVWIYVNHLEGTDNTFQLSVVGNFKLYKGNMKFSRKYSYLEDIESEFLSDFYIANNEASLDKKAVGNFENEAIASGAAVTAVAAASNSSSAASSSVKSNPEKEIASNQTAMEGDFKKKQEEFDKEVQAVKANQSIDAKIKKYKRKRGFQRTLMWLSIGAGGYFGYTAYTAHTEYQDGTDPDELATLREEVEMNSNIAYGCAGLALWEMIRAGSSSRKIKKLEKSKTVVDVIVNDRFSGLGLSYNF